MANLKIRSLTDSDLTAELVRDVCHVHPAWVHAQMKTESESELQSFLDCTNEADYLAAAAKLSRFADAADAADDVGIYYDGEIWRVTSTYVREDGTECWNDTDEALGDYANTLFADEDQAQLAADDLAGDEESESVRYAPEQVR